MTGKAKLPRPLERTIQRSGIARLQAMGLEMYRRNVMTIKAVYRGRERVIRAAEHGQADTYGWVIATGQHVEIEWKRPGNRPTLDQLAWLKWCTRQGAIAFWSDNPETAVRIMEAVLAGGKIVWGDGDEYDVIMPRETP